MTIPPRQSVRHAQVKQQATFGSADGLVLALGLVVSLSGQPHALVKAAVAAGVAEMVGMSAGCYLSDARSGLLPAAANGAGALAACVLPALPYLFLTGAVALVTSLWLVLIVAGFIAYLRPERGVPAVAMTFGILTAAALLCWAVSLVL